MHAYSFGFAGSRCQPVPWVFITLVDASPPTHPALLLGFAQFGGRAQQFACAAVRRVAAAPGVPIAEARRSRWWEVLLV